MSEIHARTFTLVELLPVTVAVSVPVSVAEQFLFLCVHFTYSRIFNVIQYLERITFNFENMDSNYTIIIIYIYIYIIYKQICYNYFT